MYVCMCVHVYVYMHVTTWKWPQESIGSLELELLGDPGNKLWSSAGAARAPNFEPSLQPLSLNLRSAHSYLIFSFFSLLYFIFMLPRLVAINPELLFLLPAPPRCWEL